MKKLRFLCDADGIVADFVKAAVKVMTELSGQTILPERIVNWEVTEVLDSQEHRDASKAAFNKAGFCEAFETYDGAAEAIRELNELTELHFVTAPLVKNPGWMPERMDWLVKHFGVKSNQVNFISEKHITHGRFLLEDSDKNLDGWMEENPNGIPILWDRPWNRHYSHPRVIRIHTWKEVIDIVKSHL